MTTPNLEQIDQFAEIVWRKACDRARAAEGNPPTTAKWEDVVTQDEWRSMVTDVIAAIRDSGLTVIALPEIDPRRGHHRGLRGRGRHVRRWLQRRPPFDPGVCTAAVTDLDLDLDSIEQKENR